ncbi:MAG: hypothetical protein ACLU38_01230 [Dysosmobacter sp.]
MTTAAFWLRRHPGMPAAARTPRTLHSRWLFGLGGSRVRRPRTELDARRKAACTNPG